MNAVYIRVALYFLAPLLAMVPGIEHDPTAGTIILHIEKLAMSMPIAIAGVVAIFAKWGTK